MTTAKPSLETAPTTLEDMMKLGRFNLRLFAQELGLFATEESKASFMQLSNEGQAQALLAAADKLRKGGGKGKPAAAAGTGATQRTPSTGKAAATGRKPSTRVEEPPEETPAVDPAAARAPATTAAAAGTANTVKLMKDIAASCEGIKGALETTDGSIVSVQSTLEAINMALWFNIALTVLQIEQAIQIGRDEIIEMALQEIPGLKDTLNAAQPGGAEEEYPEEGNA
jgi:hypothetical protein